MYHYMNDNWHLKIFKKSILKQAKLDEIRRFLPPLDGKVCLDLGGDNGIISYFLREGGGVWHSADLTDGAVASIRSLVKTNVFKVDGETLPFPDRSLDLVVIIDFLEHIPRDREFISELARVMKPSGVLLINVPHLKRRSTIRWVRKVLGLTDEKHGHLRPGYTREGIKSILEGKFTVTETRTYSKFFTEMLDALIQVGYGGSSGEDAHSDKGLLVTERELKKKAKKFKLYTVLYPFFRCFSALDGLLWRAEGEKMIVKAVRA